LTQSENPQRSEASFLRNRSAGFAAVSNCANATGKAKSQPFLANFSLPSVTAQQSAAQSQAICALHGCLHP
jgi:hypothetical protein